MTDAIDEIRSLLGPLDPASGHPAPHLQSDTILRAILQDTPAELASEPSPEAFDHAVAPMPPRRPARRRELASCVAVLLAVVALAAALRFNGSGTQAGRVVVGGRTVVTQPEAPLLETSPEAARLLPPDSATIDQLVTYATPVDSTYQQLYLGTRTNNPPELLVATIDTAQHRSGSLLLSSSLAGNHQPVRVGSIRANLSSAPDSTYLWWAQPNGVEVDVTATHLTASEVIGALHRAHPSTTSRLGLDIPAPLPAGLHLSSTALSRQPGTSLEDVDYHQGTCAAQLEVFSGLGARVEGASGTTRITTLFGHQALVTTNETTSTLVWAAYPGVTARLSASSTPGPCGVTTVAQQVHLVTPSQWEGTVTQLGEKAHHVPPSSGSH
ncbi:MAG: hypothetical protein M3Y36_00400 [Actinomycetota bacterium]|nr:hypothetical protein [Actinomycetota bacterium]